jgi:hypothetical protein
MGRLGPGRGGRLIVVRHRCAVHMEPSVMWLLGLVAPRGRSVVV